MADNSCPTKKSSIINFREWSELNIFFIASVASCSSLQIITPFPAAKPSALITVGYFI